MSEEPAKSFVLPKTVISRIDLAKLVREFEEVDSLLEMQKVRNHSSGQDQSKYVLPNISQALEDLLSLNQVDINNDQVRVLFKEKLGHVKDKAPIIHMTFACQAEPESLQYLADWIRQNIHPEALISVGLQPSLIGGVYIRTPNHVHDFSLRSHMQSKKGIILKLLEGLI